MHISPVQEERKDPQASTTDPPGRAVATEAAWRRTLMRPRCAAYDVLKHAAEAGAVSPASRDRPPAPLTSHAGERSRRWCWTAGQKTRAVLLTCSRPKQAS